MRLLEPERNAPGEDEWMGLVTGRFRPGVVPEQARREMDAIFQQDLARKSQGKNLNNLATRQYFVGRTLELQPQELGAASEVACVRSFGSRSPSSSPPWLSYFWSRARMSAACSSRAAQRVNASLPCAPRSELGARA